mmetsp:Transcript_29430/g.48787  ORF Transcript_29430/g.48787 Transcript_29430/m.48787 type:complete len:85 (+) Transcript_29430:218-472(+)
MQPTSLGTSKDMCGFGKESAPRQAAPITGIVFGKVARAGNEEADETLAMLNAGMHSHGCPMLGQIDKLGEASNEAAKEEKAGVE